MSIGRHGWALILGVIVLEVFAAAPEVGACTPELLGRTTAPWPEMGVVAGGPRAPFDVRARLEEPEGASGPSCGGDDCDPGPLVVIEATTGVGWLRIDRNDLPVLYIERGTSDADRASFRFYRREFVPNPGDRLTVSALDDEGRSSSPAPFLYP